MNTLEKVDVLLNRGIFKQNTGTEDGIPLSLFNFDSEKIERIFKYNQYIINIKKFNYITIVLKNRDEYHGVKIGLSDKHILYDLVVPTGRMGNNSRSFLDKAIDDVFKILDIDMNWRRFKWENGSKMEYIQPESFVEKPLKKMVRLTTKSWKDQAYEYYKRSKYMVNFDVEQLVSYENEVYFMFNARVNIWQEDDVFINIAYLRYSDELHVERTLRDSEVNKIWNLVYSLLLTYINVGMKSDLEKDAKKSGKEVKYILNKLPYLSLIHI